MQESDFFRNPVGTGPFKLQNWDAGQAITLIKNDDYFKGTPNIEKVIFKIIFQQSAMELTVSQSWMLFF